MLLIFWVLKKVIFVAIGEVLLFGTLFFGFDAVWGDVLTNHIGVVSLFIGFGGGSLDDGVWYSGEA